MTDALEGLRVLLVEDSPLVAAAADDMLTQIGCVTVGPATTMALAVDLVENGEFDAAVVDMNIRGAKAFSLLKVLDRRKIPYLISSGYADWTMPAEFAERPRLAKPFGPDALRNGLTVLIAPGGAAP